MAEEMLTLPKFEEASEIVKKVTQETKLVYSKYFSEQTGNKVYLKPENMQLTGAYKLRGAYYKISTLSEEERAKGLLLSGAIRRRTICGRRVLSTMRRRCHGARRARLLRRGCPTLLCRTGSTRLRRIGNLRSLESFSLIIGHGSPYTAVKRRNA